MAPLLTLAELRDGQVPVIVRGDGCYLEDSRGNRYLDGLAGLSPSTSATASVRRRARPRSKQLREPPFHTN